MNKPHKPDAGETVARLEARIDEERAALEDSKARQRLALIGIEQGKAGAEQEADALAVEVRERRDRVAALAETLAEARVALDDIAADATAKEKALERALLVEAARECRKLADAHDKAISAVVGTDKALREAISTLFHTADGPTRSGELGELSTIVTNLPLIVSERLAHGNVVASRTGLVDRSGPAPSVKDHLARVLDLIAPGPGRPKKSDGAEPADIAEEPQEIAA